MVKSIIYFFITLLLIGPTLASAAGIPKGYGETKWGTDIHSIMKAYPKGQIEDHNKEIIYTQENPDDTIALRIFAFKDGKLTSVAVTFNGEYVKKTGIDKLKEKYVKEYGKGKPSALESSSHMTTYVWDGKKTKIKFITVPNRPDMTVLSYEKK